VAAGQVVKLNVDAELHTAVIYLAYYSNGKNGAQQPYGSGYGGNNGGMTDRAGNYSDQWVIGISAPIGRAHVHVEVSYPHKGGRDVLELPLTVTSKPENC
jgi:hypothetical protein